MLVGASAMAFGSASKLQHKMHFSNNIANYQLRVSCGPLKNSAHTASAYGKRQAPVRCHAHTSAQAGRIVVYPTRLEHSC